MKFNKAITVLLSYAILHLASTDAQNSPAEKFQDKTDMFNIEQYSMVSNRFLLIQ